MTRCRQACRRQSSDQSNGPLSSAFRLRITTCSQSVVDASSMCKRLFEEGSGELDPLEVDHVDLNAFEGACGHPFSFFYLSSEECREAHSIDDQDAELQVDPAGHRKQATTHINVTSEEVSRSTGEQREKWLGLARKKSELDIKEI